MNARLFKRSMIYVGLALIFSTAALWAAPTPEVQSGQPETIPMVDMRGRTVEVPPDIKSIIALQAGSLRLISYFDAVDQVIAVEDSGHGREKSIHDFFHLATYRIAYPELQSLPSVGSIENHEAIIAAAPDIVFSTTVDVSRLDQIQDVLGIPVFALDADVELSDLDRFNDQILLLGEVLGEQQRARELVDGITALLSDIAGRTAQSGEPKRAYAGGMMYYGPADLLRTTGDYIPFDLTGTENVMPTSPAGNFQPYLTSLEDLIAADPQYVFIDAANDRLSRSGFEANRGVLTEHVQAFTNRDAYNTLVYKYYGTNWENQIINIYYAGKVMYPSHYSDTEITRKAEEIWELFFQRPLDYRHVIELQGPGMGRVDWMQ